MPYQFIREIGSGGMGSVYEGRSPDGKHVAIKMLRAEIAYNPEYRSMFEQEARILKQMNHPSVVRIIGDSFSDERNNLYLPMEFIEGESLSEHIIRNGPFSENEAIDIMVKILKAMEYVHQTGNAHRDIKPSNVMLKPNEEICVIDFGIAKDMKTHTGKTIGMVIGTDGYMSPEQAGGNNIDHRTDIYSLGCLLFFLVTGRDAVTKKQDDYATRMSILYDDFPQVRNTNPNISEQLERIILKAVDKNMTKRFQTAREFISALSNHESPRVFVSVGRQNCDLIMDFEYISGHHLDIDYSVEPTTGGLPVSWITITDSSTNGTGINGKFFRHNAFRFSYKGNMDDLSSLPIVHLAGRSEYELDWSQVLSILREKVKGFPPPPPSPPPPPPPPEPLGCWLGFLSWFCPIAGWVIGALWKNEHPQKARSAVIIAWISFVFYLLIIFCSYFIQSL